MNEVEFDRFKRLVHYVCTLHPPELLGAVRLNKILWFADCSALGWHGKTVTSAHYQKRPQGPVARCMLPAQQQLEADGHLEIGKKALWNGRQMSLYRAHGSPDMSDFSKEELDLVTEVANTICNNFTADGISDFSHDRAWELAGIGEDIPVESVFTREMLDVSKADMDWARTVFSGVADV